MRGSKYDPYYERDPISLKMLCIKCKKYKINYNSTFSLRRHLEKCDPEKFNELLVMEKGKTKPGRRQDSDPTHLESSDDEFSDSGEKLYEVETLLKYDKKNDEFLVQYAAKYNEEPSWQPAENVRRCTELIEAFNREQRQNKRRGRKRRSNRGRPKTTKPHEKTNVDNSDDQTKVIEDVIHDNPDKETSNSPMNDDETCSITTAKNDDVNETDVGFIEITQKDDSEAPKNENIGNECCNYDDLTMTASPAFDPFMNENQDEALPKEKDIIGDLLFNEPIFDTMEQNNLNISHIQSFPIADKIPKREILENEGEDYVEVTKQKSNRKKLLIPKVIKSDPHEPNESILSQQPGPSFVRSTPFIPNNYPATPNPSLIINSGQVYTHSPQPILPNNVPTQQQYRTFYHPPIHQQYQPQTPQLSSVWDQYLGPQQHQQQFQQNQFFLKQPDNLFNFETQDQLQYQQSYPYTSTLSSNLPSPSSPYGVQSPMFPFYPPY